MGILSLAVFLAASSASSLASVLFSVMGLEDSLKGSALALESSLFSAALADSVLAAPPKREVPVLDASSGLEPKVK